MKGFVLWARVLALRRENKDAISNFDIVFNIVGGFRRVWQSGDCHSALTQRLLQIGDIEANGGSFILSVLSRMIASLGKLVFFHFLTRNVTA